jgi:DUF2993 family protein
MPTAARRVLITVLVLAVLFVVADRLGDYVAESAAADTIKDSQHLTSSPDVDIAGFPFLTQLAAGDFDEITIDADDLPVGDQARQLDVSHLKVVLHGVSVPRDFSRVHADSADATARVGYDELGKTLGVKVTYAGSGRIRASTSVTALGRTVSGSITARPRLRGNALSFGDPTVDGAGDLAEELTTALNRVFDLEIPLSNIPFRVRVQSLETRPDGIVVELTGRDLDYVKA